MVEQCNVMWFANEDQNRPIRNGGVIVNGRIYRSDRVNLDGCLFMGVVDIEISDGISAMDVYVGPTVERIVGL